MDYILPHINNVYRGSLDLGWQGKEGRDEDGTGMGRDWSGTDRSRTGLKLEKESQK